MPRRSAILLLLCLGLAAGEPPAALPGIWLECEAGSGHTRAQANGRCSGGRLVGWVTPATTTTMRAVVAEPMPRAVIHLHYNQIRDGAARVVVRAADGAEVFSGRILQPSTGGWGEFAWTSLPIGALAAGTYDILLSGDDAGSGGHDVVVLLDDRWDGLYRLPSFRDGRPVGTGAVLAPLALELAPAGGATVIDLPAGEWGINVLVG